MPEGDQNGGTADSPAAVSAASEENSGGGFLEQLARNPLNADKYQDNIPDEESLFRNAAADYFFFNQLTDEEKIIYNAMKTVAGHPESTEYHKRMEITADPASDAFKQEVNRAYDALIYDHPEMFWLREGSGSFTYYYLDSFHLGDRYTVMLQLTEPYQNYQAEMTAFNSAVDSFFSDIDTTQAAPWLALRVHDKLNSLVSYDWELADAVIRIMDYLGKYGKEIKQLEYSEIEGDKDDFTDMLAGVHTCLSLAYYQAVTRNSLSVQGEPVNIAVVVRLIWEYTNFKGYDLAEIVRIKHEYNKTRPYKHGGKRI